MSDISKIEINSVDYDIKDATSREQIDALAALGLYVDSEGYICQDLKGE